MVLLSAAYLPPVDYFRIIAGNPVVYIEQFENYTKQSYRNRCYIYGANGKQMLNIPVKKESSPKVLIKDIRIDYSTSWINNHRKSIEAAYRHAPFFEYYADEFMQFFSRKTDFLIDFNINIIEKTIKITGIKTEIRLTDQYYKPGETTHSDYRYKIHPKVNCNESVNITECEKYIQVFSDRHGFIHNLSIIDLIFNSGPECMQYLKT